MPLSSGWACQRRWGGIPFETYYFYTKRLKGRYLGSKWYIWVLKTSVSLSKPKYIFFLWKKIVYKKGGEKKPSSYFYMPVAAVPAFGRESHRWREDAVLRPYSSLPSGNGRYWRLSRVLKKRHNEKPPPLHICKREGWWRIIINHCCPNKEKEMHESKKTHRLKPPSVVLGVSVLVVTAVSLSFTAHVV